MFKINSKLIAASAVLALSSTLAFAAPSTAGVYNPTKNAIDGGVTYPRKDGVYTAYRYNTQSTKGVNHGRTPTENEIKAWDTDILPDGTGLPEGSGSVEEGDDIYDSQCASCHGDFGAGGNGYPTLTGGSISSLKNQRLCPGMDAPKRTIGTYWPQVSTLFWYMRDAMPYAHPKSLTNDQLYALTAYLMAQNNIKIDGETLDDDYVLNRDKFLKIKLPNRDGFIPKIDGPDGIENVRAFFADGKNYGAVGVRCMKNCGKEPVMRIRNEITNVVPPYSEVKDLPPKAANSTVSAEEELYNANCKLCHASDNMGAPAVGDHEAWEAVMKKGLDKVVSNAIHGTGGMPPKGGATDLSDDQIKAIVNFMVDKSK